MFGLPHLEACFSGMITTFRSAFSSIGGAVDRLCKMIYRTQRCKSANCSQFTITLLLLAYVKMTMARSVLNLASQQMAPRPREVRKMSEILISLKAFLIMRWINIDSLVRLAQAHEAVIGCPHPPLHQESAKPSASQPAKHADFSKKFY